MKNGGVSEVSVSCAGAGAGVQAVSVTDSVAVTASFRCTGRVYRLHPHQHL